MENNLNIDTLESSTTHITLIKYYMNQMGCDTVYDLSILTGIKLETLNNILSCDFKPIRKEYGTFKPSVVQLAMALACDPCELWPDAQRILAISQNKTSVVVAEEEASGLITEDLTDVILKYELKQTVNNVLKKLNYRDEDVIRRYMGLYPYYEEWTLEQIAQEFKVSRHRILQIRDQALDILKRPYISKKLIDFA